MKSVPFSFRSVALVALSSITPVVAFAQEPARFKKSDFTNATTAEGVITIASRCSENQLARPATLALLDWVFQCNILPKGFRNSLIHETDENTGEQVLRTNYLYPVFAHKDAAIPSTQWAIWKPPFEEYAAAATPEAKQALCAVPADITPYTVCQESCLAPTERVLFEDGYQQIAVALEEQKTRLVNLAPNSTLESPQYEVSNLKTYVRSLRDEKETLLQFKMRSGGHILVTESHPLVNGSGRMRDAREFKMGESLLTSEGKADRIISIQKKNYFGKVYQVKPGSFDAKRNVYVAEGYLNGSANWQNETITDLNRLILRTRLAGLVE